MLDIRPEQLDAIRETLLQQFQQRLEIKLQASHPDHPLITSDPKLRAFIRAAMRKAAMYSISDEADVERFLIWMLPYGLQFEHHPDLPWVAQLLSNKNLTPTQKVNELENSELFSRKA